MQNFKHRDVLKIYTDLKPRTLISWSEKGLFDPAIKPEGPGTRREYSEKNLIEIGVIRELISFGLGHPTVQSIMKSLRSDNGWQNGDYDIVIAYSRQYVSIGGVHNPALGHAATVRIGKRSNFDKHGESIVFGGRTDDSEEGVKYTTHIPGMYASIVISISDIWEFLNNNPIFCNQK